MVLFTAPFMTLLLQCTWDRMHKSMQCPSVTELVVDTAGTEQLVCWYILECYTEVAAQDTRHDACEHQQIKVS
jgi:hypothetical protein